ncbi:DUF998 domain-containing protein [Luteimonas sp. Y-2-2-4F]|nr:DUF998 domain-containing protein [Luteimonas sp. Y-2-2-4F]MCD9031510.1 DUF998 domain-containing protein [Luteimonas sp. Y-2-2-4F]
MRRDPRAAALALGAHALTWGAVLAFPRALSLPGGLPLSLPGASGVPHAGWFNALAFVLPGGALALTAWRARRRLGADASLWAGVALRLWLLAALLFAAQGLLPLDPNELDAGRSRAHAAAWTAWALAFGAAAVLSAAALPGRRGSAAAAVAVALVWTLATPGVVDRLLLALWSLWTLWMAWRLPPRGV